MTILIRSSKLFLELIIKKNIIFYYNAFILLQVKIHQNLVKFICFMNNL